MALVPVVIDGKSYRMACDDGQEDHLRALAARLDAQIQDMRRSFGEIGDMRLTVMAAITLADEAGEFRRRVEALEADLAAARAEVAAFDKTLAAREAATAEAISAMAERLEKVAKTLAPPANGEAP